jgi:hypothetical protein
MPIGMVGGSCTLRTNIVKNLLTFASVCVLGTVAIQGAQADPVLTWYSAGISESTLQGDLGGSPTVYAFEDQTVNGGDPGDYLGNGPPLANGNVTEPTYGFTWQTNPSGGTKGWAPDDLTGYVNGGSPGNNWGTGPCVGASGKLLINTNNNWASLTPISVTFGTGLAGVGSLFAGEGSVRVNVYDTQDKLLGYNDYTVPFPTDAQIAAAGYDVADYHNTGNFVLYWGVTSNIADIGKFEFDSPQWAIMDNMMTTTATPEPTSLVLLATGLGGLALSRKRRRGIMRG